MEAQAPAARTALTANRVNMGLARLMRCFTSPAAVATMSPCGVATSSARFPLASQPTASFLSMPVAAMRPRASAAAPEAGVAEAETERPAKTRPQRLLGVEMMVRGAAQEAAEAAADVRAVAGPAATAVAALVSVLLQMNSRPRSSGCSKPMYARGSEPREVMPGRQALVAPAVAAVEVAPAAAALVATTDRAILTVTGVTRAPQAGAAIAAQLRLMVRRGATGARDLSGGR